MPKFRFTARETDRPYIDIEALNGEEALGLAMRLDISVFHRDDSRYDFQIEDVEVLDEAAPVDYSCRKRKEGDEYE